MQKLFILIFICILLTACGPDDSNDVTLTGSVNLIPSDQNSIRSNGNVKVMIYSKVNNDSEYSDIVKNNPGIGSTLSSESVFDHRLVEPEYQTLTNDDGSFSISGINGGTYNIVFEYDGFGFIYNVNYDLFSDKSLDQVNMHEAIAIEGFKTEDVTLEANRFYYSDYGFSMDSNTRLSIEEGAMLQIAEYRSVFIRGDIHTSATTTNPFRIFGYSSDSLRDNQFNKFQIDSLATISGPIANGIVFDSETGFEVNCNQASGFTIENMTFSNCNTGLSIQFSYNSFVRNCSFVNTLQNKLHAIYSQYNNALEIEKCIIYGCKNGINAKDCINMSINNCYIDNISFLGLKLLHFIGEINHCEVYSKNTTENDHEHGIALFMTAASDIEAEYNIFEGKFYAVYCAGDAYSGGASFGDINKNNIISSHIFLYALGNGAKRNNGTIDFTRNCFFTQDLDEIGRKILDKSDYDADSEVWQWSCEVDWEPLHSDSDGISAAGINL